MGFLSRFLRRITGVSLPGVGGISWAPPKEIDNTDRVKAIRDAMSIADELQPLTFWDDKPAALGRLQELRGEFRQKCQGYIDQPAIAATDKAIKNTGQLLGHKPSPVQRVSDEQGRSLMDIEFERRDSITGAKKQLEDALNQLQSKQAPTPSAEKARTFAKLIKAIPWLSAVGLVVGYFYHSSQVRMYEEAAIPEVQLSYKHFARGGRSELHITNGLVASDSLWLQESVFLVIDEVVYQGRDVPHLRHFAYKGSRTAMFPHLPKGQSASLDLVEHQTRAFRELREKFDSDVFMGCDPISVESDIGERLVPVNHEPAAARDDIDSLQSHPPR